MSTIKTCRILGVNIAVTNMAQTVQYIENNLEELRGKYICVSNVHTTIMAHDNPAYRNVQNSAAIALPDGKPLSVVSRKRGYTEAERVTGPDLMGELFARKNGLKHFFYGDKEETLQILQQKLKEKYPDLQFLVPLVNEKRRQQFEEIKAQIAPELDMHLIDGKARQVMIAAEATLLASGTAALEAMLCKSPMVVGYRMKPFTHFLAKRLVKTKYISLPNLLADEMLVPEMIQEDCEPQKLAEQLSQYLGDDESAVKSRSVLIQRFTELHKLIQCDADSQAAQAVIDLLEQKHD